MKKGSRLISHGAAPTNGKIMAIKYLFSKPLQKGVIKNRPNRFVMSVKSRGQQYAHLSKAHLNTTMAAFESVMPAVNIPAGSAAGGYANKAPQTCP